MLVPWKKNYDKPRQYIKKQRHHFVDKGLYSQSYGFFQAVCDQPLQSHLTLCDPRDCSPPGSSVHGVSQERILQRAAVSSSGDLPNPGINLSLFCLLHWEVVSLPLATKEAYLGL